MAYESLISSAISLIKKQGQLLTIKSYVEGPPDDPSKPWRNGPKTLSNVSVFGVWLEESQMSEETRTEEKNAKVILSSVDSSNVGYNISLGDFIERSGVDWKISKVTPVNPAGDIIVYVLELTL